MESLLTKESFDSYLKDSRTKAFPAQGIPAGRILLDPLNGRVSLNLLVDTIPDLTLSERLNWETLELTSIGKYNGQLSIQADEKMYEGYLLISDIAGNFSLGQDLQRAVRSATSKFAELIEADSILSPEKQLGLIGELLVLGEVEGLFPERSLEYWVGPERSEHDFKFPNFDLEVKTTSSESRKHKIGTMQQLMENPGRDLYLASFQLTKTPEDSGISLGGLVNELRRTFLSQEESFIDKLEHSGWRARHNHLYSAKFAFRNEALAFKVDANFPRVLSENLILNPSLVPRITEIEYSVNLDHLEAKGELFSMLRSEQEVA